MANSYDKWRLYYIVPGSPCQASQLVRGREGRRYNPINKVQKKAKL